MIRKPGLLSISTKINCYCITEYSVFNRIPNHGGWIRLIIILNLYNLNSSLRYSPAVQRANINHSLHDLLPGKKIVNFLLSKKR